MKMSIWSGVMKGGMMKVKNLIAIDPIYDDNGQRTPESDDKFCDIVDNVESILSKFFIKEER